MKFLLSFLLSAVAAQAQAAASAQVGFAVFVDKECTVPLREGSDPTRPTSYLTVSDECYTMSYTSPMDGHLQTNSFGNFHCDENSVTWSHWPSSEECFTGGKMLTDRLSMSECTPVMTHMGITYQKLMDYTTPCTATHEYPADQKFSAETHGQGAKDAVQQQQMAGAWKSVYEDKKKKMGEDAKGKSKKGKKMLKGQASFRVAAEEEADCPMTAFEIRSSRFSNMCLDSSLKRGSFKKCAETPAQKFFVSNGHIMKSDEPSTCMSGSMTFGPCSQPHTLVRKGATHQVKLSSGKCMTVMKNGRIAGKPCGKQKTKAFSFVPLFDAVSPAAPSTSGFRVIEEGADKKKKGKKGGNANPFGNFRVGGGSEGGDEKKKGGKKKKGKKGGNSNPFGNFRVGGGSEGGDEKKKSGKKKKGKKGGNSNPFGNFRVGGGSADDDEKKKGGKKKGGNSNPFGGNFRVGGGSEDGGSEDGKKKGGKKGGDSNPFGGSDAGSEDDSK